MWPARPPGKPGGPPCPGDEHSEEWPLIDPRARLSGMTPTGPVEGKASKGSRPSRSPFIAADHVPVTDGPTAAAVRTGMDKGNLTRRAKTLGLTTVVLTSTREATTAVVARRGLKREQTIEQMYGFISDGLEMSKKSHVIFVGANRRPVTIASRCRACPDCTRCGTGGRSGPSRSCDRGTRAEKDAPVPRRRTRGPRARRLWKRPGECTARAIAIVGGSEP